MSNSKSNTENTEVENSIDDSLEKAIKILADKSINIDLILLDLIMPGMNGMEFLQKLKADSNTCNIPVIMQSAIDVLSILGNKGKVILRARGNGIPRAMPRC